MADSSLGGPGHVLVLNQYVVPDPASTGQIAFEIAAALAGAGHRVTFLAGQPSYLPGQPPAPARERRDGVEIRRLEILGRWGRRTRLVRFLGYLLYLARALLTAAAICRSDSVELVLCFHNPPFLPLVGALLARRRRFVCVVMDIHPDVIEASGWMTLPAPVAGLWNRLNLWAYRRAARVVVISEDMRSRLAAKGLDLARIESIPMWAQPELSPATPDPAVRERLGIAPNTLLVLFSGNMGITQRLGPVFEAARELAGEPVHFVFAGGGIHAERWARRASTLTNVTFLPFQPEAGYRELVAASDAGLVTLAPALEPLVVPSRAFPLLSAGVPLLAVMSAECELGRIVTDGRCGACARAPAEIAAAIRGWIAEPETLRAAGGRARAGYLATRRRAQMTDRYISLVRALTHCGCT